MYDLKVEEKSFSDVKPILLISATQHKRKKKITLSSAMRYIQEVSRY